MAKLCHLLEDDIDGSIQVDIDILPSDISACLQNLLIPSDCQIEEYGKLNGYMRIRALDINTAS